MKNALDDVNAAFAREDRHQGGGELCRQPGLDEADRARRACRRFRFRRSRLDGLRQPEEAHQGRDPHQSARQPAGADRTEGIPELETVAIGPGFDLAKLAGDGRIATGDVASVPVGKYAKAALEKARRLAGCIGKDGDGGECARRARSSSPRGEAPWWASSTRLTPKWNLGVRIVGVFPEDSHAPVTYPVAATVTPAKAEASSYLTFLRSGAAKIVFEKYGFTFLIKPTS